MSLYLADVMIAQPLEPAVFLNQRFLDACHAEECFEKECLHMVNCKRVSNDGVGVARGTAF